MATVSNLTIDQGTTYSESFTVKDNTGTVRDLSSYTARSQMRRSYYTTANTAFTANVTTPANGHITLSLTSAQTAALKPGRHVYDIEIVKDTTTVERVFEGIVTVYPEATK
jgi:hypothetical protein